MLKIQSDVFNKMLQKVHNVVDNYQTDFAIDIYHLMTTTDSADAYLWLCRPCGTNLYPLPLDEYGAKAVDFYIREQGDKIELFKVTASELQELTIDQVKEMF